MIEQSHTDHQASPPSPLTITSGTLNTSGFWCHICQRKFCSSSALFQHGKRLSHLKRAMKISSSRCTTITNGKITSSIQRPTPISVPIPIVHSFPEPPAPPAPSSASSCTSSSLESMISLEPIAIRKHYHTEKQKTSYTCQMCNCRCWSIRNIHRHLRLHADVRPFHCNRCQMKFKSYANLFKHFKTSRHQTNEEGDDKQWMVDTQALEEQKKLISQVLFIEDPEQQNETQESETNEKESSSMADSDNLLEDLHIPDSRLIDGDAAELALIDPNTFEELHKAAECLLNLQGVFYFGEEEHGTERTNPFTTG